MWRSTVGFIVALTLSIFTIPLTADGQTPVKVHRIGFLNPRPAPVAFSPMSGLEGLRQGLRGLAYVESQNLVIEYRWGEGREDRLPDLAADLVRLKVDVIFAVSSAGVRAARKATQTILIVAVDLETDPVASGLASSLARPAGNITGLFLDLPALSGKLLELLKEAVPDVTRVAILWDAATDPVPLRAMEVAAQSLGVPLHILEVRSPEEFESAFATASRGGARALIVLQSATLDFHQTRLADLAALPQDAWSKPSACALWEIRDVVAHVSGVPTAYTGAITRGLEGDITPRAGSPDQSRVFHTHSQEERQQYRMELAQRILANRERRGNDLVSVFSQGWDPFPPFIASLSAEDWHKPCHHSFGIIPVQARVHAGVFALAMHSWDIRSALEPSAPLSPDTLAAMLDFFAACPHWFFTPAAKLSTPIRYRFAFTGALSGPWDIVVEGDKAHIGPAADATPAHMTFSCESETFVLMMCGRIGFDAALGDQRLIPTGDMAVVQEFKKWFQGV